MLGMIITLLRFAVVTPIGDIGTQPTPPFGLAYLAAMCKAPDVEIKGIDAAGKNLNKTFKIPEYKLRGNGLDINEIIGLIDPKTEILGISSMFSLEWLYVRDCIKLIKEKFPNVKIFVGGEHASALPEYCLRDCKAIDYICLGEGEETWSEILETNRTNKIFDAVAGLAYLKNNKFIKTEPRKRIRHINNIPWPDWDIFPIEPYLDNSVSFGAGSGRDMPILASRGCPYECTFCSNPQMFGRNYFLRDIDDLIKQIKFYIEKYKITGLQFYDLTAVVKKKWVLDFVHALKANNIELEWSLPTGTRSEALDLEVIQALASVNLKYIVYAPESGSATTLARIKKKIKLPRLEQSMKFAMSEGIGVKANLIIGFPGETRLQVYSTLYRQIKWSLLGVEDVPIYYYMAYPGTELFDDLVKEKKVILDDNFFHQLATLTNYNLAPTNITYNEYMNRYELYFYRMFGMTLFYLVSYLSHPTRILRTIKSVFTDKSASVPEQRLKDHLRSSNFFNKYFKPFVLKLFFKKAS
jgi:anaerobic magnesium-protoporphyrin IX monomethyl ester cyclase